MNKPRWWLALAFVAGLGLLAGCSPSSSTSAATTTIVTADFVMVAGEGSTDLAQQIASQGLVRPDGTLRTLVSEHVGTLELPGRTIQVVAYETGSEGDTLPCLAIVTDDGESGSTFRSCGTSLPENIGVLWFESGGPTGVLIVRVSIETASVRVVTSNGGRITARPAGRVAYLEWPTSVGRGTQVVGLDANGDELWSRVLPGA